MCIRDSPKGLPQLLRLGLPLADGLLQARHGAFNGLLHMPNCLSLRLAPPSGPGALQPAQMCLEAPKKHCRSGLCSLRALFREHPRTLGLQAPGTLRTQVRLQARPCC